ncbi:MAG: TIGR02300 family protein [Holosporaceae bacterium]|jgi:uncharacterized protein (TIGR02300 family)|nr:TIGR02300 family protein [Holosporaceae bacterium]
MNKNWGIKRVCLGCATRFYDFNKSPIICPNCNVVFDPDYLSKRKKTKHIQEKNENIDDIDDIMDEDPIEENGEDLDDLDETDGDISLEVPTKG